MLSRLATELPKSSPELATMFHKFSPELRRHIVDYLVPYYNIAVTVTSTQLRQKFIKVAVSSDIWAHCVTFHGKKYIAYLSNKEGKSGRLLYRAASSHLFDTVYVAYDPWGVKEVLFAHSDDTVQATKCVDTFWETIRITPKLDFLKGETDVSQYPASKAPANEQTRV